MRDSTHWTNFSKETVVREEEGRGVIANGSTADAPAVKSGLWLHFQPGNEPIGGILRRVFDGPGAALVSHVLADSAATGTDAASSQSCYELVLDGLTFEVFQVGPGQRTPDYMTREIDIAAAEALVLLPGPHLASAGSTLPVVRGQWQLAHRLCALMPAVAAVGWAPSRTLLAAATFRQMSEAWTSQIVFPPQGLVTFGPALGNALQSRGLAHFTDQELRIEPELAGDRDHAVRLGLRLAETLLHRGALTETEQFGDPAGGTIRLEPSANHKFVRVWRG